MVDAALTVMVVSPSEAARRLLELILGRLGHRAALACDGDEALEQLGRKKPALILVDARAQDEDTLLLMGLLQRRHPELPRLALHEGQLHLFARGMDRTFRFGGGAAQLSFPTQTELEHVLQLVEADRLLTMLRPPLGRA